MRFLTRKVPSAKADPTRTAHHSVRLFQARSIASIVSLLIALFISVPLQAELPRARLFNISPPGAMHGSSVELVLTGQDLDDVNQLYFSSTGITAKPKPGKAGESIAGQFLVTVAADVKPGFYDVRAIGRYGISNPRTFQVGAEPQTTPKPGNTSPQAASEFPVNSAIHAVAEANAAQYFRVTLKKGDHIRIATSTAMIESRMEPVVTLIDPKGRELARSENGDPLIYTAAVDGQSLLKVHDVLYRGGPDYFYRLSATPESPSTGTPDPTDFSFFRWPVPSAAAFLDVTTRRQMMLPNAATVKSQPAQHLDPPCVVAGRFEPGQTQCSYNFIAPAGTVYWIEVISHRLGEPTSPMLLVQRIEQDAKGEIKVVDVQEAYESPPSGVPEFSAGSRDPVCRLEIKQPGNYRATVRNLFQSRSERRPTSFHLEIRSESPNFQLVAIAASPMPDPKDSKEVPISTTLLRRAGVTPIRVIAQRRDGFTGEIRLQGTGLPPGITASPTTIPSGSTSASLMMSAAPDAAGWVGPILITGTGRMGDTNVIREARPAVVSWTTYDGGAKRLDVLRSRLSAEFMLAVSGSEDCPLSIIPVTDRTWEIPFAGKLSIPLKIVHRAELTGPISLKLAGHPLLAAAPEVTVDAKADSAAIALDLNQAKLPPGEYALHIESQAKVKYAKKTGAKDSAVADVTASFYSLPITIRVLEAPKPAK